MNWVAPIKDEETLRRYEENLLKAGEKYYIMFEIGVGTGMQVQDVLGLKVGDVRGKDTLIVYIGKKEIRRSFRLPEELKQHINSYTAGMKDEDNLFPGMRDDRPLSREQAYRALKDAGERTGLVSIGAQTMRKTFAWRYYKNTGDIHYLCSLLNHASPSVTYRYIGEKPSVDAYIRKMTPEENERARRELYRNGNGVRRMEDIKDAMDQLEGEMRNPANNDAFYGRVDVLLKTIEELLTEFRQDGEET